MASHTEDRKPNHPNPARRFRTPVVDPRPGLQPEVRETLANYALDCELLSSLSSDLNDASHQLIKLQQQQGCFSGGVASRRLPIVAANLGNLIAQLERKAMRMAHLYEDVNTL